MMETPAVIVPPAPVVDQNGVVVPIPSPGAGGWVPSPKTPLWVSIVVGSMAATAPVLVGLFPPWGLISAVVLAGGSAGLASYFGMLSAGPRSS
jgi:hypothetical protein